MTVPYPLATRTIIRSSKARSQPAAFRMAVPRRGARYAQAGGAGAPRVFSVTFRFTSAEAQAFQQWFVYDLDRGVLDFTMPIRTEAGVETLACRFAPGALLDAREVGEVWEYTATLIDVGYVAPPTDWPVLPEADVPAYPLGLRTIIRASKARSQPAAFTLSDPRAGYPYAQASGYDTPTVWSVEFRFTAAEAQTFQDWFRDDLQLGVLAFTMPIRTEFGVSDQTCRFLDDGLLDASEVGEVWSYRATIEARAEVLDGIGDPYYADVTLLMHFDDSIVDECGHSMAADGTSNNTDGMFGDCRTIGGGASVVYSVAASSDWDLQGDFTVEGWVLQTYSSAYSHQFLRLGTAAGTDRLNFSLEADGYGHTKVWASWRTDVSSSATSFFHSTYVTSNVWHHLALTRQGSTFRLFLDGTLGIERASAYYNPSEAKLLFIGNSGRSLTQGFPGLVDEVRITNGVARYTAAFTPPTAPFRVL